MTRRLFLQLAGATAAGTLLPATPAMTEAQEVKRFLARPDWWLIERSI